MAGWFELSKSGEGRFRFVLKAGNGETILSSELYKSKGSAEAGIASVQANCTTEDRYERKTASNGKSFFNLKAANHQVIGTSQMYASERSRDSGIASVKNYGTTKAIKDNCDAGIAEPRSGTLQTSALPISKPLVMHLEVGQAKASDLAELFHELSVLYRMVGGSGITFYYEQSKEKVGVAA